MRLFVIALATALACAGCGLFSTRPAQPPGGGETVSPNFTVPESTLATLSRAVHDQSTTNYGLCFADTLLELREFHAVFDPADVSLYLQSHPSIPDDWRREDEIRFFPQFISNFEVAYTTYFTVDNDRGGITNVGGPTQKQIWNMHYRVWAGVTPVVAGSAGITFERIGNASDYKITYWEDHRDTTNVRTWGLARLNGR